LRLVQFIATAWRFFRNRAERIRRTEQVGLVTMTTAQLAGQDTESSIRFLDDLLGAGALKQVGFRFWDGTEWPDAGPREATLVLRHPGALRAMFAPGTEKGLAEAYLRDDFDIEGRIEGALELADLLHERGHEGTLATLRHLTKLWRLPGARQGRDAAARNRRTPRHTLQSDRRAVSFHYDLSNDFYRLWLDRAMLYSCAYFASPDLDLDAAQQAKMRHICRKLRLRVGQRLLDIGCGWGGLAIYAARHHGARVTGITLSREQAELASRRARDAGLADRVTIALQDYRELTTREPFDAIVSVGMAEHVGAKHLPGYFQRAGELLKPGGVFLNHAIGDGVRQRPRAGGSFIDEYVFPDSDIPPIRVTVAAAESAGFEVRDVENLREHYARTLRLWVERLERAHDEALRFVDEKTYRVWRLYMAGSAHGFAHGQLAIYQTLLAKPDANGAAHLPLTRADWYSAGDSD
jgi:cyclopropane-fatty-acyl-phospholipid synthase